MRNSLKSFTVLASVLAVQGALISLAAMSVAYAADSTTVDPAVAELTQPSNTVEVGASYTDKGSYKFGEYSGLEKKGGHLLGGFDLRGGGAYDSDNPMRFRIIGSDLGTDNRNLSVEYGEQGRYRLTFGYDEIVKNISDSFQTPYNGAGSGLLTLPANWATHAANCNVTSFAGVGAVGTAGCGNYHVLQNTGSTLATPTGNMAALTAAELADFRNVNLSTQRKKFDFGLSFELDRQWQFNASATQETKDGIQALGMASPGSTTSAQVTILNPIKYRTNQFNLNLTYTGDKSYGQLAYYASLFSNGIGSVVFENPYFSANTPSYPAGGGAPTFPYGTFGRTSTAPSNQLHQLNLTGGYNFDKTTKLVANMAYSRNTQNEAFLPERMEGATAAVAQPTSSLNGVVVTKALNLKLTTRPMKSLGLSAAYKYDDRDNQTPTNLYVWRDTDTQTAGTNRAAYNWAYSKKLNQLNLEADWAFQKGQAVKAGLERQKINRRCDSRVWDLGCVNSADHTEDTARIDYRNNVMEAVTARVGYAASSRSVSAYNIGSASTAANNNVGSQGPLTRFNMTDRNRDKLRASITWQATEQLDLTVGYDYNKDKYATGKNPNGGYLDLGLKTADSNVLNLDGSYKVSDTFSVNAFYSREERSSKLNGSAGNSAATVTPTSIWTVDIKDKVDTFGLGFKATEVRGKWDLSGDYVRSSATSPYDLYASGATAFSTTVTNPTALQTANAYANYSFPDTFEKMDALKFSAKYTVDKKSAWRFGYTYQRLSSSEVLRYTGLQTGTATSVQAGSATAAVNGVAVPATNVYTAQQLTPTNEQAPNYTIQSISVTYIYTFK